MAEKLLPKGYIKTELGVIPDEWEIVTLRGEIDQLEAGVSVNSVNDSVGDAEFDISILKTSSIANGKFIPKECKKIDPKDLHRAKCYPRKGTLILSRMNTPDLVGEIGYVDRDYPNLFLPDRLWMTQFKRSSSLSAQWLCYLLNTEQYKIKVKGTATGTSGSMKNISKDAFFQIAIPKPRPDEQLAIATALSDIDALVAGLDQLIAKKTRPQTGRHAATAHGAEKVAWI